MPVTFRILPASNLVYVRYTGDLLVAESLEAFQNFARHPDMRIGQRHLVDLRRITSLDKDFAAIMRLQATKAASLANREVETLIVYLADGPISQKAATLARNAWTDALGVVPIVQDREVAALDALGLPFRSLDELLAQTGRTAHE